MLWQWLGVRASGLCIFYRHKKSPNKNAGAFLVGSISTMSYFSTLVVSSQGVAVFSFFNRAPFRSFRFILIINVGRFISSIVVWVIACPPCRPTMITHKLAVATQMLAWQTVLHQHALFNSSRKQASTSYAPIAAASLTSTLRRDSPNSSAILRLLPHCAK